MAFPDHVIRAHHAHVCAMRWSNLRSLRSGSLIHYPERPRFFPVGLMQPLTQSCIRSCIRIKLFEVLFKTTEMSYPVKGVFKKQQNLSPS